MVGPAISANGGIAKVIEYYSNYQEFWKNQDVFLVESHNNGTKLEKVKILFKSLSLFLTKVKNAKIVHLHFAGGMSANRKLIFYYLSRLFGLKVVSHLHTSIIGSSNNINWSFKTMVKKSDSVIVLSPILMKELNKKVAKREYKVLNNPSQGFISSSSEKEKIILFAGRLQKGKGYHDLINSLKLVKSLRGYRVIIAGSGEIDHANELITRLDLKNIETVGWVESKEILEIFKRSKIFILPSYREGFPISIIDALSNKCAIITTPVGGIPDFLKDGETCLFFKSGDICTLAHLIEKLINDEELRTNLAENGFKLARTSFDLKKITEELTKIYSDLEKEDDGKSIFINK